jgi:hypothetical protein
VKKTHLAFRTVYFNKEKFVAKNYCFYMMFLKDFSSAGVNIMITIFSDFDRFSVEKMAIFLQTNVLVTYILGQNRHFFAENIFKNHNIDPSSYPEPNFEIDSANFPPILQLKKIIPALLPFPFYRIPSLSLSLALSHTFFITKVYKKAEEGVLGFCPAFSCRNSLPIFVIAMTCTFCGRRVSG